MLSAFNEASLAELSKPQVHGGPRDWPVKSMKVLVSLVNVVWYYMVLRYCHESWCIKHLCFQSKAD